MKHQQVMLKQSSQLAGRIAEIYPFERYAKNPRLGHHNLLIFHACLSSKSAGQKVQFLVNALTVNFPVFAPVRPSWTLPRSRRALLRGSRNIGTNILQAFSRLACTRHA